MLKRVILHIGLPKTGTSAIQHFLFNNRIDLKDNRIGFYVPQIVSDIREYYANGSFLNDYVYMICRDTGCSLDRKIESMHNPGPKRSTIANVKDFSRYASGFQSVILSEEQLWWNSFFWEDWWAVLRHVIEDICGQIKIQPVIYLRRQDDWILSWWKQYIRFLSDVNKRCFRDYLLMMSEYGVLDYNACLENLEKVFGYENIIVRPYNQGIIGYEAILRDFLDAIGCEWNVDYKVKKELSNPSVSLLTAYALFHIDRGDVMYNHHDKTQRDALRRASRLFSMAHKEGACFPLPLNERRSILDRYIDGNRKVAERYGIGSDLFDNEIKPYELLSEDIDRDLNNAETIVELTKTPNSAFLWINDNFE